MARANTRSGIVALVAVVTMLTLVSCRSDKGAQSVHAPPLQQEDALRYDVAQRPEDAPGPCSACGPVELLFLDGPTDGPLGQGYVDELAAELRRVYGLDVGVAAVRPVPHAAFDASRGQYDGSAILDDLASTRATPARQAATLIAVMNEDIFLSAKPEWRWAFGTRQPYRQGAGHAVISVHRMEDRGARRRMLVMVGKYIASTACGFPLNSDPTSLMFDNILSAADLDGMSSVVCHRASSPADTRMDP